MRQPKGNITNIDITKGKIGPERRQEILDGIADKGTFLPRGVSAEDMDSAVVDFFNSEDGLSISIDGEKIPVIFLTIQRWNEFSKTWTFSDKYKNVKMPFITILRKPDIQQGQNQAGLWNIPGKRTYTYMKVPTWDGARRGVDLYKIPQPVSVDLTYEVRIFTTKMKELNNYNTAIQLAFQSRQCYINVKGHPMPLHLESIGDESNIDDFENKRFYVQTFEVTLLGYILEESQFEVIPTINRTVMAIEVEDKKVFNEPFFDENRKDNTVTFNFLFKPMSNTQFSFILKYNVTFTLLQDIKNINRITIIVNNVTVFDGTILNTPLILSENDEITIKVNKNNLSLGEFKLIGKTITT
jgi:hypothetical protein